MPSLTTPPKPPECSEDEKVIRSLLWDALTWTDEDFVNRWNSLEFTLIKPLNEYSGFTESTLKAFLAFLNRVLHHKFYSLQLRAFRMICTENVMLQVGEWTLRFLDALATPAKNATCTCDKADLLSLHDIYRKYTAKAFEMNVFSSSKSMESAMRVNELVDKAVREHYDEEDISSPEFREFEEMLRSVHTISVYPSGYDRDLVDSLVSKTEFLNVSDYLSWLFLSLKFDYEYSLGNDLEKENVYETQANIVVLVMEDRPHISVGLEFSASDFLKMVGYVYNNDLMVGSLFTISLGDGPRIPVVVEKREWFKGDTFAVPISFDYEGNLEFLLNSTVTVEFAREFFEPYRKVLLALKRMAHDDIPLLSQILSPRNSSSEPKEGNLRLRRSEKQSPFTLNSKQIEAVNMSVADPNLKVNLIQGPPGTGKTFVALDIIDSLLHNLHCWDPDNEGQILIISLKNDTVDNILMSLLDDGHGVLRLGGMSTQKCLRVDFNYSALKNFENFDKNHILMCKEEKRKLLSNIKNVKRSFDRLGKGIISFSDLAPILSSAEMDYLENNSITDWLFEFEPLIESDIRIKHISSIMNSSMKEDEKKNPPDFVSLRALERRIRQGLSDLKLPFKKNSFEKILVVTSDINLHYNITVLMEYCAVNSHLKNHSWKSRPLVSLNREERWQMYGCWFWALESMHSVEMTTLISSNLDCEKR